MTAGVLALTLAFFPNAASAQDDVQKLRDDLTRLEKKLDLLLEARKLERKISDEEKKDVEARLRRLEDDVRRLRRRSYSFDPQSTEMGSVVLRNDLDVPATVTINGRSYVVRARTTRTLSDVPVGSIRYLVTAEGFGVGPARYSTVNAIDPLTIRIYDTRRDLDR
jgi:hypothetical protein